MTFALFILYVVLSYMHPGEIVPALAPYRVAYWVGMSGLAVAIAGALARAGRTLASVQLRALVAFAIVTAASLIVADRWLGAPLIVLQRFGPSLAIFVLAVASITSLERLRVAVGCIVAVMVLLMVQGAAAYHFGYNASVFLIDRTTRGDDPMVKADEPLADVVNQPDDDLTDEAEDTPRIRGLGLMHDPNDLAMGMIAALGLIGGAWRARAQLRHVVYAGMAAALVYGVYLTRSRGGALALVVVFWRFAASRFGRVPAVVVLVALCAGAMAVDFGGRSLSMEPDESASGRLLAWREGLEMLKSAPMLGVGYGQFEDHHNLTAHNSLVLCFAETGLLGCFFWVAIIVVTMIELQQVKSLPGDDGFDDTAKRWAEGLELSLVGLLTAAFFLSRTFVPTLYLVVGLAAALAAIVRAADRPLPLPALPTLGLVVLASEAGGIAFVYAIVKLHLA